MRSEITFPLIKFWMFSTTVTVVMHAKHHVVGHAKQMQTGHKSHRNMRFDFSLTHIVAHYQFVSANRHTI